MTASEPNATSRLFEVSQRYTDLRHDAVVAKLGADMITAAWDQVDLENTMLKGLTDQDLDILASLPEPVDAADAFEATSFMQMIDAEHDFDQRTRKLFGNIGGYSLGQVAAGELGLEVITFPGHTIVTDSLDAFITPEGRIEFAKTRREIDKTVKTYTKHIEEVSDEDRAIIDAAVKKLGEVNTQLEAANTSSTLKLGTKLLSSPNGITVSATMTRNTEQLRGSEDYSVANNALLINIVSQDAKFMQRNPKAASLLKVKGYSVSTEPLASGVTKFEFHAPALDGEADGPLRFVGYNSGKFSTEQFLDELSRGNVIVATDGKFYEAHDNVIHRPAWELVNSLVPSLADALVSKAGRLVEGLKTGGGGNHLGLELAKKRAEEYATVLDDIMSLDGITLGMTMESNNDPQERASALGQTIYEISLLFTTPQQLDQDYESAPRDPEVTDSSILEWARALHEYAGLDTSQ